MVLLPLLMILLRKNIPFQRFKPVGIVVGTLHWGCISSACHRQATKSLVESDDTFSVDTNPIACLALLALNYGSLTIFSSRLPRLYALRRITVRKGFLTVVASSGKVHTINHWALL